MELRAGRLGLGVEGRYDYQTVGVGASARATVQRATGSLLPCAHFGWVVTCGIAALGDMWARGEVAAPVTQSTPYFALGGRIGADIVLLPRLHLLGTADVVGVATPANLFVDGSGTAKGGPIEVSGGIALLFAIL